MDDYDEYANEVSEGEMLDQIEQELRAAFSWQAARVDSNSIARLRVINYHARLGTIPRIALRSLIPLGRRLPPS